MLKTILGVFFGGALKDAITLRYGSYGWIRKLLILLLITALTAAAIVMEFIAFNMFKENVALAIILCIFFIALGTAAFRLSLFFSGIALRMVSKGTAQEGLFAKKVKNVTDNKETYVNTEENVEPTTETTETNIVEETTGEVIIENGKTKYKTKGLDIAIGVLGFVYAIGVVVTLCVVLYKNIESLRS